VRAANVYVDGFNFYYGSVKGTPYKWLDFDAFAHSLLRGYTVNRIKYFTARVDDRPDDPSQSQRQDIYLQALATIPTVEVILGQFRTQRKSLPLARSVKSGRKLELVTVMNTEEKGSDVSLGAHVVWDACHRTCETIVVISNDSDLQTPIDMARRLGIEVIVVNPHRHRNQTAHLFGDDRRNIRKTHLAGSQLPEQVQTRGGVLHRPSSWL